MATMLDIPDHCRTTDGDSLTCAVVFDWTGSETWSRAAEWTIGRPLAVAGLVVTALLIRWVTHRVVDRVVARSRGRRVQRTRALGSMTKSLSTALIFGVAAIMVVAELGYNVAPLVASAGVVGLAIGFGAQSLVKDVIAGIFLILEDQYGLGDRVTFGQGGVEGVVEAVTVRITRVRDDEGAIWYIRNGEILQVANRSQAVQ